jgi:hypothetical protein
VLCGLLGWTARFLQLGLDSDVLAGLGILRSELQFCRLELLEDPVTVRLRDVV